MKTCEACDGEGEICTMRGSTSEDDEFTRCPDCDGEGNVPALDDAAEGQQ